MIRNKYAIILFSAMLLLGACSEKKPKHQAIHLKESAILKSDAAPIKKDSLLDDKTYTDASFPGGLDAMRAYVRSHIRYPKAAIALRKEGRVIVKAHVDEKGNILSCEVMMSDDALFNDEALRIVRSMPRLQPATHQGKPVAGIAKIPIMFRLK